MKNNKLELISQSVLGVDLTEEECQTLADICSHRKLVADEVLFNVGESDEQLYVIAEGKIEVIKNFGSKDETIMATLKPGSLAGELSFIDGEPHSMTLKSRKESHVIVLKRQDFEGLINTNPMIVYHVMRAILRASHKLQRELNSRFMEMNRFVTNQYM